MTSNQKRRVVVTGMGVVAPNGHGLAAYKESLEQGRSGIRAVPRLTELSFACQVGGIPQGIDEIKTSYFSQDELLAMNESMVYAAIAAVDAFEDAGLSVPEPGEDRVYEDTGGIIGTGIGGMDTLADYVYPLVVQNKVKRLGSTVVERIMASSVSAKVGGLLALGNQVTSNSSACSTGTEAVILGTQRIRAGLADRMVVGGAEGSSPFIWSGFDSMKVLSRKYNEQPEKASRPMSSTAGGFVPSSGSGVLVIETLEAAEKRGARIYAEILGTAINSGGMRFGGSMTAPSPRGVERCVRAAVMEAGITSSDIDYINGHLTATMADPIEVQNWSRALERGPSEFPFINSTKSMIGHALGAAGALEAVSTILQLHHGFIHGSLNCEDLHEEIMPFAKSVVHNSIKSDINIAAKASFGFGDVNSCIIFKKWGKENG